MVFDADACYRAVESHDARFDGRFFVAVSSTRIYCRPVCRVKTPKRENCTFFPSAAAAEARGYRPCLRCRPELAPGNASVDASQRLAQAAASALEDDELDGAGLAQLAQRLGVTDRHLRRVFQTEFGVSPVAYAQTQRLLLAKRLLTDTRVPITDVAFASGFASVRRFNALFKERYRLNPLQLRKKTRDDGTEGNAAMHFELSLRPPYDWSGLVTFLGSRAIDGVEDVREGVYRRVTRVVRSGRTYTGWVEIAPIPRKHALSVNVSASLAGALPPVLGKVKHLMDLSADPAAIGAALGTIAAKRPGLRVPGAFDGFEIAVRAILGQQISVKAARTMAGRVAKKFGTPVETPFPNVTTVFPRAEDIAAVDVSDIIALGITTARAQTILTLARAIARGELALVPNADVEATLVALRELPGIGEWTAQYIAMRALAWPDAFPHSDLGLMKALGERNPKRILAAGEAWRPWRAYAAMHLWYTLA